MTTTKTMSLHIRTTSLDNNDNNEDNEDNIVPLDNNDNNEDNESPH